MLDADKRTSVGGRLDSIDVLEADRTGRVMLAALTGARSPVVRGEELRGILGRAFGVGSVRSPRFTVTRRGTRSGEQFIFEGSGFGHGAGLCQFGAMTRLRAGASARDVIEHYYPGRASCGCAIIIACPNSTTSREPATLPQRPRASFRVRRQISKALDDQQAAVGDRRQFHQFERPGRGVRE